VLLYNTSHRPGAAQGVGLAEPKTYFCPRSGCSIRPLCCGWVAHGFEHSPHALSLWMSIGGWAVLCGDAAGAQKIIHEDRSRSPTALQKVYTPFSRLGDQVSLAMLILAVIFVVLGGVWPFRKLGK